MTDRFTRGYEGERHKGKRIATIYTDSYIDGDVTMSAHFDELDPQSQIDILNDAIGLLKREREICESILRERMLASYGT